MVLIISAAVFCDIRTYSIPNKLILLGYALACLFCLREGAAGLGKFFAGALLPIVTLILLQRAGIIGGGDVKLLSVAGSFLGAKEGMWCVLFSFLFGALLSAAALIWRKNIKERICFFRNYIQTVVQTGKHIPYYQTVKDGYSGTIHFSIAVLSAVLLLLWL